MKVLTLYAGLGGNRKLWEGVEVTAVELREDIAAEYRRLYPGDEIVVGDAHEYLAQNFSRFDFIWSSPPCQSHSKASSKGHNQTPRYPDMKLYQEIIFLKTHFAGKWVVENVDPYYKPLIAAQKIGRHLFWSNFHVIAPDHAEPLFDLDRAGLEQWLGISYSGNIYYDNNHDPCQILRNCVHPVLGKAVLDSARGVEVQSVDQMCLLSDSEKKAIEIIAGMNSDQAEDKSA